MKKISLTALLPTPFINMNFETNKKTQMNLQKALTLCENTKRYLFNRQMKWCSYKRFISILRYNKAYCTANGALYWQVIAQLRLDSIFL